MVLGCPPQGGTLGLAWAGGARPARFTQGRGHGWVWIGWRCCFNLRGSTAETRARFLAARGIHIDEVGQTPHGQRRGLYVLLWMHENPEQLPLFGGFSVNLSGQSLNDDTFLDFIFDAMVRYPVPREKLVFEITETVAITNLEDAAECVVRCLGAPPKKGVLEFDAVETRGDKRSWKALFGELAAQ